LPNRSDKISHISAKSLPGPGEKGSRGSAASFPNNQSDERPISVQEAFHHEDHEERRDLETVQQVYQIEERKDRVPMQITSHNHEKNDPEPVPIQEIIQISEITNIVHKNKNGKLISTFKNPNRDTIVEWVIKANRELRTRIKASEIFERCRFSTEQGRKRVLEEIMPKHFINNMLVPEEDILHPEVISDDEDE